MGGDSSGLPRRNAAHAAGAALKAEKTEEAKEEEPGPTLPGGLL